MEIQTPCTVALTWVLKDSLGDVLDTLDEPMEFLVGGDDLLPAVERALQGHEAGASLQLNLEPEDAFGLYDENLVFLLPRAALPEGLEEGMLIEASALPAGTLDKPMASDALLTVTDIYPDHVVLDGNHPLAGILLRLALKVVQVRPATQEELDARSAGTRFFRVQPMAPGNEHLH